MECWICELPLEEPRVQTVPTFRVTCQRCGSYDISASLRATKLQASADQRRRLMGWVRHQTIRKRQVRLMPHTIESIVAQLPDPNPVERSDHLLVAFATMYPIPGAAIHCKEQLDYPLCYGAQAGEFAFHFRA